jgi:hypothetical protein
LELLLVFPEFALLLVPRLLEPPVLLPLWFPAPPELLLGGFWLLPILVPVSEPVPPVPLSFLHPAKLNAAAAQRIVIIIFILFFLFCHVVALSCSLAFQ